MRGLSINTFELENKMFPIIYGGDTLGMAMGRGGAEGWGIRPRPTWFCLAPSPPRPA